MDKNMFCIFILLLFITSIHGTLPISLSFQGTDVKNKSTGFLLTVGNLNVSVWDSLIGGNKIYNEHFKNAITSGSWNVMLGENSSNPLELNWGMIYYMDYSVNGEDVNFTNLSGDTIGRKYFYSPLGEPTFNATTNERIDSLNTTKFNTGGGTMTGNNEKGGMVERSDRMA